MRHLSSAYRFFTAACELVRAVGTLKTSCLALNLQPSLRPLKILNPINRSLSISPFELETIQSPPPIVNVRDRRRPASILYRSGLMEFDPNRETRGTREINNFSRVPRVSRF